MTTVHANTSRDALSRVEQMIGMSGIDIPPRSARAQIASALNIVIQIERAVAGRRRLVSVSELTGMEGDVITMQEIFQIGSASWRERVCQYVSLSVVAGALKKK